MSGSALVTGANGFIGATLVRYLAKLGVNVHGVDRTQPDTQLGSLLSRWTVADVSRGLEIPPGIQGIFHCAGAPTVGRSFDDPLEDFRANVETTAAVLSAARVQSPKSRIVLVSSAAVYGDQHSGPISVGAEPRPHSPYGIHKHAAEVLCRHYARTFGLRIAIVRLFSVYGPGLRKQLLWDACSKLLTGKPTFAGSGSEVRDWLHVDDAVTLLVAAQAGAGRACPTVNGGTGVGTTVTQVIERLCREVKGTARPVFTGERRSGDPYELVADIASSNAIGWTPRILWQDGIAQYARWYLDVHR
jgi:UDP-glucose 4-epimerase